MRERGTVVRLSEGRATVRLAREAGPACRQCRACQITGGELSLWVEARDLAVGDEVTLEVPLPNVWRSIALVFGLPLAAVVAGLVLGSQWAGLQQVARLGPEGTAVAASAVLGALAFLAALVEERRFARRHRPEIVEVQHRSQPASPFEPRGRS
jgi:positive regulator of sigma E activity